VASPVLWTVQDGRGKTVQVREKQWAHIEGKHPVMSGEEEAIRRTVSDPDIVIRPSSRVRGRGIERRVNCRLGAHSRYNGLYVWVPIDYGTKENWVVTAYPNAGLPEGDVLYVRIPFRDR
jgi:hypothetical protein